MTLLVTVYATATSTHAQESQEYVRSGFSLQPTEEAPATQKTPSTGLSINIFEGLGFSTQDVKSSAVLPSPQLSQPAKGSNVSGDRILFRWSLPAGTTNIVFELSSDPSFQNKLSWALPAPYTGVNISGFSSSGNVYYWRVMAKTASSSSDWSDVWDFTNGGSGSLEGNVFVNTNAVAGVKVTVDDFSTLTDENGRYSFKHIVAGTKLIKVSKAGYNTTSTTVDVRANQTSRSDFSLTSTGETASPQFSKSKVVFKEEVVNADVDFDPPEGDGTGVLNSVPHQYVVGFNNSEVASEVINALLNSGGVVSNDGLLSTSDIKSENTLDLNLNAYDVNMVKNRVADLSLAGDVKSSSLSTDSTINYAVFEVIGDEKAFINNVDAYDGVSYVEPRMYAKASEVSNDPQVINQYSLYKSNVYAGWKLTKSTNKVKVAVIDTGVDYNHEDLASVFGDVKGYDFVDLDSNPLPDDYASEYHGTHVAGIIAAASNNSIGIAGVTPNVQLYALRALNESGSGTFDDVADAINWATANGIDIVNMSLGGGCTASGCAVLQAAVANAYANGVALVAASGNSGAGTIDYPAAYPQVTAVGSLSSKDSLSTFSNRGSSQELVASGEDIVSTFPNGQYAILSGTSMSTPLVTGMFAAVLAEKPEMSPLDVRVLMASTTDDLGNPGWDSTYGYGRANLFKALASLNGVKNIATNSLTNTGAASLDVTSITTPASWIVPLQDTIALAPNVTVDLHFIADPTNLKSGIHTDKVSVNYFQDKSASFDAELVVSSNACTKVTDIPLSECNALERLYISTNGSKWRNSDKWLVRSRACDWYGVRCSDGHVDKLDLDGNNLTGELPEAIGDLPFLRYFYVDDNALTGGIPASINKLSNLTYFYAYNNNLTSPLPSDWSNLQSLERLYLYSNSISGELPSSVANLTNLKYLLLHGNNLTGQLPENLGNLSNVVYLYLNKNSFTGSIPVSIGNLKNVERFYLYENKLTGSLPSTLGDMPSLEYLALNSNNLTGVLPDSIGRLNKLRYLNVEKNSLSGTIPESLYSLTNLERIYMSENNFSGGLSANVGNMTGLRYLYINHNAFVDAVPATISKLSNLSALDVRYNGLWATDSSTDSFVSRFNGSWTQTQTVAPTNVSARYKVSGIEVAWNPIQYTSNDGGYYVSYSTSSTGPFKRVCNVNSKNTNSCLVTGLDSSKNYYFVVQSFTLPHIGQANTIVSNFSVPIQYKK